VSTKKKVKKNNLEEILLEVKDKILNFLSIKPRTEKEIDGRLDYYLRKYQDLDENQVEDIKYELFDILTKSRLIDDKKYAAAFVKEKIDSPKTISKLKVKQFLLKKGVSENNIEDALMLFSDELEEENMKKDAEKKLSLLRESNFTKKKSKLISFLASKGYPYQKIYAVVDIVLGVK